MKLYCGRGFNLHVFHLRNRNVGLNRFGEGKVGLSRNILVESNIPKS